MNIMRQSASDSKPNRCLYLFLSTPPQWLRLLSVLRRRSCCCWLVVACRFPIVGLSVFHVLCMFLCFLVLQSSWWRSKSWLFFFVCLSGVLWLLLLCSLPLVWSVQLLLFRIKLTCFFHILCACKVVIWQMKCKQAHLRILWGGGGTGGPDPPEKSQKYKVS